MVTVQAQAIWKRKEESQKRGLEAQRARGGLRPGPPAGSTSQSHKPT